MIESTIDAPQPEPRMNKVEALARVGQLKRWVVGSSIAVFLALIGLITARTFNLTLPSVNSGDDATQNQQDQGGGFFEQGGQQNNGGTNGGTQSGGSLPVTGSGSS
jgi:uncharacterized membrane protein YgcG